MPRQTINLNDNHWRFGQVPRRPFTAADVNDLAAVTEWLPATIPGNVRTDLLALNRIPDPFFGEGYQDSLWVEAVDWWYRRRLQTAPLAPDQRAFLIFEGIDYLSAIFVNGQEMARHEGMFSRQIIEVTGALHPGPAELAVRLWGSSALPRRHLTLGQRIWQKLAGLGYRSWPGIYPDRSASLKCQMSFGWDFAPPIRTMGIWDEASLVISGPVFIAGASVVGASQPPTLGQAVTHAPADISINLTLEADRARRVGVTVRISPANFQGASPGPFQFSLDLPPGRSNQRLPLRLPQAALWQPWDRGRPHLYHFQIEIAGMDGQPLDERAIRTGLRAIELQAWQFSLNNQPEFIRGLNWVPADSFPGRLRAEDYARLLAMARQSGANLLRVWGGGLREKQAFYDLCDELGLLVWQEFPFACMFLGAYPRHRAYLRLVEAECGAIVRQLRHHPSVVVWCGGNEFSRRRNRPLLERLAALVHRHDGTRPFIPVSPSFEHGGDAHNWHVWHGGAPLQTYQAETARFLSEFGLQALPHLETLAAALPDPAAQWPTRQADRPKLERYASLFQAEVDRATPSPLSNLQALITNSQRAQAVALQTAIEHMRRRRGEAGGVCLWQFNEPWPAISWAIVDYFGRPKLAYNRLADWYNPILVSLKFPVGHRWQAGEVFTAEIWAINDTPQPFVECRLQISLDGSPIHFQPFDLPAASARRVGRLAYCLAGAPRHIRLALSHRSGTLARNSYDLAWFDETGQRLSHRLRRWMADWVLR